MNAKAGILLRLVPVCLCLLPAAAAAQGSIGPVQQFGAGAVVSSPGLRAGSLAYFTAHIPTAPPQPFISRFLRSDGTPEGTFSIEPLAVRFANSHGNLLFFTCGTPEGFDLCRTNGTTAGTFRVTQELSLALDSGAVELPVTLSVPERNLAIFSASPRSGSPDLELWATDGTAEGTRLVKDVNPEGSSNPRRMIAFAGRLFFLADTPQGRELWRSDGTPEGTERILDFHEQGTGSIDLVQAGGALFILAHMESIVEVWRSDGTEAGTERVLTLPQRLYEHRAVGRHLFLVTWGPQGHEMWAVDGGTGEAVRVLQVEITQEMRLLPVGDHLAFALEDDHGWEPWWSDGTPEGTHRIADICPGLCASFQNFAGTYGGRAVFLADDGVSGAEPWLTDGTAAGTYRLGDFCPGECGGFVSEVHEINGWLVLLLVDGDVRVSDGTPDGDWSVGKITSKGGIVLQDRLLFSQSSVGIMASLPVTAPAPLPGAWLESVRVPGFRFKVQIDGQTVGRQEPVCMAQTLCVSGALPGHSEVFVRVVSGQPSLIKLTTSAVDVWVLHTATGHLRHYRLNGSDPAGSTLEGILDREGFGNLPGALEAAAGEAKKPKTPQPPGRWIEYKAAPGFRVQARLTSDGTSRILRREPCVAETFCLSGAVPGLTELLVRVTGPKPNKYYWSSLARFAPATLEVWVQQRKTGKVSYYRLDAPPAGSSDLDGYVDRQAFKR
jgi:ELWxxDGT repeat protein